MWEQCTYIQCEFPVILKTVSVLYDAIEQWVEACKAGQSCIQLTLRPGAKTDIIDTKDIVSEFIQNCSTCTAYFGSFWLYCIQYYNIYINNFAPPK